MDGIEVSSAGTTPEAACPVSADLLEWTDQVFVMEERQRHLLQTRFAAVLKDNEDCLFADSRPLSLHATGVGSAAAAKVTPLSVVICDI
jgi:hypothetical protein